MQTAIDPNDLPDDRDNYRYSLLIETQETAIVMWQDDDLDDINAIGEAYDSLIRERLNNGEGMPMSVIDHYAHLKDES